MPFVEMRFKGKRVFVEVDAAGNPLVEGGRARMKYKPDDDRTYGPFVGNLTRMDGAPVGGNPVSPPGHVNYYDSTQNTRPARPPYEDSDGGKKEEGGAIIAYTDGACSGNPGPAGLGFSVRFPDGRHVARGEPLGEATNNIAELTAILRVLETVEDRGARLLIHTDSSYSLGVLTLGWKAKANQALIATIREKLGSFPNVRLIKVKGHAGVPDNELVDELARRAGEVQQIVEP